MFGFFMQQLFRDGLLDSGGQATDFAGFVAHVWWQEPGNFALVTLLHEGGLLKELCEGPREDLVAVLCHFFSRRPLEGWLARRQERLKKRSKTSMVVLPPLPAKLQSVLRCHSQEMLHAAVVHLQVMVQKLHPSDDTLPLTKQRPCPSGAASASSPALRSPFAALSGHGDSFASFTELCHTAREDLFLRPEMFPSVDVDVEQPLNAYLLDFYRHGQGRALVRDNQIPQTEQIHLPSTGFFFLIHPILETW